ncbi:hypothetical protein GOODEAATRI_031099, partial [Goodea atripinnis]
ICLWSIEKEPGLQAWYLKSPHLISSCRLGCISRLLHPAGVEQLTAFDVLCLFSSCRIHSNSGRCFEIIFVQLNQMDRIGPDPPTVTAGVRCSRSCA